MRTRFSIVALQDCQKTPTLTNQRVGHPATRLLVFAMSVFFLSVGTGHATELVVQRTISASRALAGHVLVGGTNAPAGGVMVELCSSDWKTVLASTKTDEKGRFSLQKPASGKLFYVRVSAPGMDIYELRVRIDKHAADDMTIHLSVAT
jgi:5-hydroxyisourate hydrolase-like protein (transthyretin family)